MNETTELFSLFWKNLEAHCFHCFGRIWKLTGFTVFTVLEESGSSLVSLDCFHCFGRIWKLTGFTVFTVLEKSESSLFSLFSLFWKNLEAHCFRCCFTCFVGESVLVVRKQFKKQRKRSELPHSSKLVKTVKTAKPVSFQILPTQ
jgi:hypothetical protein